MTELTLWHKEEIDRMRKDLELLFRQFRRGFGVPRAFVEAAETFAMDLSETEDTLILEARLPGIKPGEIQVSVTDDVLTLKGESHEDSVEQGETYRRIAARSQTVSRSIKLPCRIRPDKVTAVFKDDTLKITLPKCKPAQARGVKIDIT